MGKKIAALAPELDAKVTAAVENGDVKAIRALLEQGFNVDAPLAGNRGRTALSLANDRGVRAYEVAIELLKAGADWRKGNLNLVWAVYFKDEWAVKFLIDAGADVNYKSPYMGPPLAMVAGDSGLLPIARMLIDAGADIDAGTLEGAVNGNNTEFALLLLKGGAKLSPVVTPLLAKAAFKGNAEIAKALIDAGADLNERTSFSQWQNADGSITDEVKELRGGKWIKPFAHATPLIVAAGRNQKQIVESLVAAGADLYLGDANGETALDRARREGHQEIVKILESAMATKPRAVDPGVDLLLAAEKGDLDRVKEMIAAKANVDTRDERPLLGGLTPLMHAARNGHAEVVAALLDAGADIGAKDNLEQESPAGFSFIVNQAGIEQAIEMGYQLHRTALHWAAANSQAQAAKVLIERGADVNAQDRMKMSPLILAAEAGSTQIVSDLLAHGADVNLRGYKKQTALIVAARAGYVEIVRKLLAAGAKVDLKDGDGNTAMILAARQAQSEVIAALLAGGADPHLTGELHTPLSAATGTYLYNKRFKKDVGAYVEFKRPREEILKSVQLLIDAGADPHAKHEKFFTAMQLAERALKDDPFFNEVIALLKTAQPRAHVAPAKPAVVKKAVKKKESEEPTPQPNFSKAAKGKEFLGALAELEKRAGSKRQSLDGVEGGFTIHVHSSKVDQFDFEATQKEMLARGCLIFGIDTETQTRLGVLPTRDRYDALLAMQTNGVNEDVMPQDVIAFLKKLEKDQPFILTMAGFDFCGGRLVGKVARPAQLIKRMVKFCSDVFEGIDEEAAAEELKRTGKFFFWWD